MCHFLLFVNGTKLKLWRVMAHGDEDLKRCCARKPYCPKSFLDQIRFYILFSLLKHIMIIQGHFGQYHLSLGNSPLKSSLFDYGPWYLQRNCVIYWINQRADKYRLKCCFAVGVSRLCLNEVLFQEMSVQILQTLSW